MPGKESPPYSSHHSPARLQLLGYLRERSEDRQWGAGRLPRAGSETPSVSSREDLGGTLGPLTSPFLILLREITSSMTLLCCSPVPGTHASLASFPTLRPSLLTLSQFFLYLTLSSLKPRLKYSLRMDTSISPPVLHTALVYSRKFCFEVCLLLFLLHAGRVCGFPETESVPSIFREERRRGEGRISLFKRLPPSRE